MHVTTNGTTTKLKHLKVDFYVILSIEDSTGKPVYKGSWQSAAKRSFDKTEVLF